MFSSQSQLSQSSSCCDCRRLRFARSRDQLVNDEMTSRSLLARTGQFLTITLTSYIYLWNDIRRADYKSILKASGNFAVAFRFSSNFCERAARGHRARHPRGDLSPGQSSRVKKRHCSLSCRHGDARLAPFAHDSCRSVCGSEFTWRLCWRAALWSAELKRATVDCDDHCNNSMLDVAYSSYKTPSTAAVFPYNDIDALLGSRPNLCVWIASTVENMFSPNAVDAVIIMKTNLQWIFMRGLLWHIPHDIHIKRYRLGCGRGWLFFVSNFHRT